MFKRLWFVPVLVVTLAGFALTGATLSLSPNQVDVWLTSYDEVSLLEQQKPLSITANSGSSDGVKITVDATQEFQEIDGFGASLTDSSAWLMAKKLKPEAREKVLQKLFNPKIGIGLSVLRQPMGASDFALKSYTYDDMPSGQTDVKLEKFSINHDKQYIIPILKRILEINPNLKIIGSPWSPPAWMKTTNSLIKGRLKPGGYDWLALYFLKYIQAYKGMGVPIYAVTLQNEPNYEPEKYPGMSMSAQDQIEVVKRLGPMLRAAKLETKILVWDHNWDKPEFPITVLNDATAREFVAGSAFHCYGGNVSAQSVVQAAHPDKEMYFTECSGGEWSRSFRTNLQSIAQNNIIGPMRNWSRTAILWNLALDEKYGPQNGGCNNCRGVIKINQATGQVDYNVEFYALGQASKFVQSGSRRIASESSNGTVQTVAFTNTDGSRVLVAANAVLNDQQITVTEGSNSFSFKLPGNGVTTFVWQ
jgi:glucosylceramidase